MMMDNTAAFAAQAMNSATTRSFEDLKATARQSQNIKELQQVAKDFEAVFISEMIKPIFESLPTDGPLGGGFAEESVRGLLVQEYGKEIAENSGLGISDAITRDLLKMQEV